MIEKMQFISITGPKSDIDRVVDQYLSKYEIHLENALAELKTVQNLSPYMQINPYKSLLAKATEFQNLLNLDTIQKDKTVTLEEAVELIQKFEGTLNKLDQQRKELESQRQHLEDLLQKMEPFLQLDFDISSVINFRYVYCRFGRISKEYYSKFETYVYENTETLFYRCSSDDSYIWGFYFCPRSQSDRVDAVYASMHFEQLDISQELYGSPVEVHDRLTAQLKGIKSQLENLENKIRQLIQGQGSELYAAKERLESQSRNFDVRRLAACTHEDNREVFYIICGWMSVSDAASFQNEIANDSNLYCFVESDDSSSHGEPPTKLKNPKIFRPFEMFVKMYGLPSYHEMDPTVFVALTYIFIFGAMFGDAGQGLCLVVGGFVLYKLKKMDLAAIIGTAGIFSTFFGVMFGSFFGFEDVIPAIWLKPVEAMTTLPFLGQLNTVFVVAIAFGMFLILLTMIFHIINAVRTKDVEGIWFDQNAVAGLVFYGALVAVIFLFMTGHTLPAGIVLGVMFGVPLIIIMLKEPLARIAKKQTPAIEGGKGMYFVQSFFELFEVMLSYLSNTLSFVRVGAFAVSHAAMMEVVLMLAGAEAGSPNWIVVIIGNVFVTAMEGLIVGIQVLRLEYYEMFSRFYKGSGKPFRPFLKKKNK
ncbi:MAG: ATPase [Clostridia bacterium]|nr:ATPase [Clostridia bacterium]NCC42785.1 ATPase [Clostridia bacterium]